MAGKRKLTPEAKRAAAAELIKEAEQEEALASLPEHEGIKKLNKSVHQAVKDTGATETQVRIAEILMSSLNIAEFYRELKNPVDDWMNKNATYRNPKNEDEYWYSPDGKGNPPKWLVDLVGPKPKSKKPGDMEEWLKKAKKYKVETEESKEVA